MPRFTARERREGYLREYGYQKKTGKPFFPGPILHDTVVNLFFILLVIVLAVVWYETAGHGSSPTTGGKSGVLGPLYEDKANPAVEGYDPRPDWYFFFLFQLLRIFSNPNLLLLATIIIPTIWIVLLLVIPFVDRRSERRLSRRPIAVAFATGMAILLLVLTYKGSAVPPLAAATGPLGQKMQGLPCASCHTLSQAGWNGNVGPNLNSVKPQYQIAVQRITNGGGAMPSFKAIGYNTAKIECIAAYVASVTNGGSETTAAGGAPKSPTQACAGVPIP